MAAVERRDPLLIAARAHKTLKRAAWKAAEVEDQELAEALFRLAEELGRVVGNSAVVRVPSSSFGPRCA